MVYGTVVVFTFSAIKEVVKVCDHPMVRAEQGERVGAIGNLVLETIREYVIGESGDCEDTRPNTVIVFFVI